MVNHLSINRSMLWKIIKKYQDEQIIPKPFIRAEREFTYRDLSLSDMVEILLRYNIDIKNEIDLYIPIDICCSNKLVKYQMGEDNFKFQIRLIRSGLRIRKISLDELFD